MRRINAIMPVVFLGISLAFFSCQKRLDQVELTDWQFEYNNQWYPAKVPGFIHTDLMANGIIADPYYGSIEDSVQWVGDSTWIYRTYLHYDKLPEGDTLWLVFEGLAGNVTLWIGNPYPDDTINGVVIVPQNIWLMDNMFCRYEVPMPGVKQMKELYLYKDSMPIMLMFDPPRSGVRHPSARPPRLHPHSTLPARLGLGPKAAHLRHLETGVYHQQAPHYRNHRHCKYYIQSRIAPRARQHWTELHILSRWQARLYKGSQLDTRP